MFSQENQWLLLQVALESVRYGLTHHCSLPVTLDDYPKELRLLGASFVTLKISGQLRGCIGTLSAYQPLIADIAEHAYAAAFRDPRFAPVSDSEFDQLEIDLSILGPSEKMTFDSEADLIAQLRPGVDGLILEERGNRGTFLPSVWESLPEPSEFLRQLKRKAGLPGDYWSDTLKVSRYATKHI